MQVTVKKQKEWKSLLEYPEQKKSLITLVFFRTETSFFTQANEEIVTMQNVNTSLIS